MLQAPISEIQQEEEKSSTPKALSIHMPETADAKPRETVMPAKNDPNKPAENLTYNRELLVKLNNFRDKLTRFCNRYELQCAALNGLKVVDCLRFVIVNEPFIRYAFENPSDMNIYTHGEQDKVKGVVRDSFNTAIHIDLDKNVEQGMANLQDSVLQFTNAIETCKTERALEAFVKTLEYTEDTGCLAKRIQTSVTFAQLVASSKEDVNLDELIKEARGLPEPKPSKPSSYPHAPWNSPAPLGFSPYYKPFKAVSFARRYQQSVADPQNDTIRLQEEMLMLLFDSGIALTEKMVLLALQHHKEDWLRTMIQHAVSVNPQEFLSIYTLLYRHIEVLDMLVQRFFAQMSRDIQYHCLKVAIECNNSQLAKYILSQGVRAPNPYEECNLLTQALAKKQYQVLEAILATHLDPSSLQDFVRNLFKSYDENRVPLIAKILADNPQMDLNDPYNSGKNNILQLAILNNYPLETIVLLCRHGANIHHKNSSGKTPLILAVQIERWPIVLAMITNHIPFGFLDEARLSEMIDLLRVCLKQQKDQYFAQILALMKKYPRMNLDCKYFVLNKILLLAFDTTFEEVRWDRNKVVEILYQLLQQQAPEFMFVLLDFERDDEIYIKNQLLCNAVEQQNTDIALEILKNREDTWWADEILLETIKKQMLEVAVALFQRNVKPKLSTLQLIIFLLAQQGGDSSNLIATILQKFKVGDLNELRDATTGNTGLHEAILHGASANIIALLCANGADCMASNTLGHTPLHLAISLGRYECIRAILQYTDKVFSKEESLFLRKDLGEKNDIYLLLDLAFKNEKDVVRKNMAPFVISPPQRDAPLSWEQFEYVLNHFNTNQVNYIDKFIDKHLANIPNLEFGIAQIIKNHAKATCHYLRDNTGVKHGFHQVDASKNFLKRILCEGIRSPKILLNEIHHYVNDEGELYKSKNPFSKNKGSGSGKHSRAAYIHDWGLFKQNNWDRRDQKFADLPKEAREEFTRYVKTADRL